MKWKRKFSFVEKIVVALNICLFIVVIALTKVGFFPSTVGFVFLLLISISIILTVALLLNKK